MMICAECQTKRVPETRKKFCSSACAARSKRSKTREARVERHRHKWACLSCGQRTQLGRRQVKD